MTESLLCTEPKHILMKDNVVSTCTQVSPRKLIETIYLKLRNLKKLFSITLKVLMSKSKKLLNFIYFPDK